MHLSTRFNTSVSPMVPLESEEEDVTDVVVSSLSESELELVELVEVLLVSVDF